LKAAGLINPTHLVEILDGERFRPVNALSHTVKVHKSDNASRMACDTASALHAYAVR